MNANSFERSRVHTWFKEERIWISTWNIIEDQLHKITIVKSIPKSVPKISTDYQSRKNLFIFRSNWFESIPGSVRSFYFKLFDNIYWKFIWCSQTLPLSLLLFENFKTLKIQKIQKVENWFSRSKESEIIALRLK